MLNIVKSPSKLSISKCFEQFHDYQLFARAIPREAKLAIFPANGIEARVLGYSARAYPLGGRLFGYGLQTYLSRRSPRELNI